MKSMEKVLALRLEERLYEAECEANSKGRDMVYYIVTNPKRFLQDFLEIIGRKYLLTEERKSLDQTTKMVIDALTREEANKITRTEKLAKGGLVELIEIPIVDYRFTIKTPFESQETPIVIFRVSKEGEEQRPEETVTTADLEYICQNSKAARPPALKKVKNLFIDAINGTDLTAVRKLIDRKEVNLSLKRLREASEYTISTWIKTQLLMQGREFKEPEGRTYISYAKDEGIISRSDFAQAQACMYVGNAAIHHDFLAYTKLNAVLFLHWLADFTSRTIGFHRLPKSRVNGTSFSDTYIPILDEDEYRLRRAIFDQLQFLRAGEQSSQIIFTEKGQIYKEEVMGSAIRILKNLEQVIKFEKGEAAFMQVINFWNNEIKNKNEFTPQDAIRAAMFAHSIFYHSKNIDQHLDPFLGLDDFDPNLILAIRKKGMHTKRFDYPGLKKYELQLQKELEIVARVSNQYFKEHLEQESTNSREFPTIS